MVHFFNRVMLLKTNNIAHYASVRRALTRRGVKFATKVEGGSRIYSAGWRYGIKGFSGNEGENKSFDNEYIVYVKRQDLELARYALKEVSLTDY